jgi:L-ascorbate metabolism protein UlaG (beta-lactamase superfamily)
MKITKFSHACVRLEQDGRVLVIDPGNFSEPAAVEGADAVIITHGHADHLEPSTVLAAYRAKPDLLVLAPEDAIEDLGELGDAVTVVKPDEQHDVAGFGVRTFGGQHATIVEGFPVPQNVGYLVDDALYYPGDSFFLPGVPVETLLAPASAPWMKIAETIAFVRAVQPVHAHPTHDAILADVGRAMVDAWFERAAGVDYSRLPIGEAVDR